MLWENLADAATLSVSSERSTLPRAFVQTPHLDQRWRSLTAPAWIVADLGAIVAVDLVAALGTNFAASSTWQVRVSTADATGAAGDAFDSGSTSSGISAIYGAAAMVLPVGTAGRYVRLDLADASLAYLEAGRLVAGPLWRPDRNFSTGYSRSWLDPSVVEMTPGGHIWVDERPMQRGLELTYSSVSEAELKAQIAPLMRAIGLRKDVAVLLDTASADLVEDMVWGLLRTEPNGTNRYLKTFRHTFQAWSRT
ncbi:hypothetical protein GC209_19255 [bacterium]|nr:hypothetical protein [bacterium]